MAPLPETLVAIARIPVLAIGLPIGLGGLVGMACSTRSAWYTSLEQPPANPPNWAFGPVWTILYGMMGYASHLTVQVMDANTSPATTQHASDALGLYYAQLGLNLVWMPLFFGAKKPTVALVDMLALGSTVWAMTEKMRPLPTRVSTNMLLVPYLAWLGYATYLNAGIVYLNWNKLKFM